MNEGMNINQLIKKLKSPEKSDRKKISLYLSEGAYKTFRAVCEKRDISAGRLVEEFMKEFSEEDGKKNGERE